MGTLDRFSFSKAPIKRHVVLLLLLLLLLLRLLASCGGL